MKENYLFKNVVITLLFLLPFAMVAQTIKGKVTDSSGGGLPYVNVIEKGTTNGIVTDINGEFSVSVKKFTC